MVKIFPQLEAKIKPKGLLDDVVPEGPGAGGSKNEDDITHVEIGPGTYLAPASSMARCACARLRGQVCV